MPNRPLIGITIDQHAKVNHYESPRGYAQSVQRAGGLPVLLPYQCPAELLADYLDRLDGLLLSGGNDLSASRYGQAADPRAVTLDAEREAFEFALLAELEKRQMPVLGICLGCQVMNVHRGGSLHQFLPEVSRQNPIEHRRLNETAERHDVELIGRDSQLYQAIRAERLSVNTSHKQAVDRLGAGLVVTSLAPDGVIESFEDASKKLWLGVQWHPERLPEEPAHQSLFRLLVDAARK